MTALCKEADIMRVEYRETGGPTIASQRKFELHWDQRPPSSSERSYKNNEILFEIYT